MQPSSASMISSLIGNECVLLGKVWAGKAQPRANAVAWSFIPQCTKYCQHVPNMVNKNTKFVQQILNISE